MSEKTPTELSRRRLFAGAGTAGALAAAAVVLPLAQPADPAKDDTTGAKPERGGGYQVTPHVLRYYQTAKV